LDMRPCSSTLRMSTVIGSVVASLDVTRLVNQRAGGSGPERSAHAAIRSCPWEVRFNAPTMDKRGSR
jgi:hypothetical protein